MAAGLAFGNVPRHYLLVEKTDLSAALSFLYHLRQQVVVTDHTSSALPGSDESVIACMHKKPTLTSIHPVVSCIVMGELTGANTSFYRSISFDAFTAFWAIEVVANLLLTLLIVGKLMHMHYRMSKVLSAGQSTPYASVSAMIVESSALFTVVGLAYIIVSHVAPTYESIPLSLSQVTVSHHVTLSLCVCSLSFISSPSLLCSSSGASRAAIRSTSAPSWRPTRCHGVGRVRALRAYKPSASSLPSSATSSQVINPSPRTQTYRGDCTTTRWS
jgi:hypothetical protein